MSMKLNGGKFWQDSYKAKPICGCGNDFATETITDPSFSKDLSGNYEQVIVCRKCYKKISDELRDDDWW